MVQEKNNLAFWNLEELLKAHQYIAADIGAALSRPELSKEPKEVLEYFSKAIMLRFTLLNGEIEMQGALMESNH